MLTCRRFQPDAGVRRWRILMDEKPFPLTRIFTLVTGILLSSPAIVASAKETFAGIPARPFGLEETHRMYQDAAYDFGAGATPYPDAGRGPYTHYVDNTHPNSTNENNPFGTPERPRRDIFDRSSCTLPAGAVVEIHGGPYTYKGWRKIVSQGTAQQPVFVRPSG